MSLRRFAVLPFIVAQAACTLADGSESDTSIPQGKQQPPIEVTEKETQDEPWTFLERTDDVVAGMPQADFTTPEESGPESDFSLQKFDTPVKGQGSRGWCTAFAAIGAMENLVRHGLNEIVDLSEIDHWKHYQQYSVVSSVKAATSTLIVPEASYPYWGSPISNYRSTAVAKITSYKTLASRSAVFDAIRAGHPVVFGGDINASFRSTGSSGRISSTGSVIGGHAMVVVGFKTDTTYGGGGQMLFKNSWGSKWGDLGYARVPYDYCTKYRCSFLEIEGVQYDGKVPSPAPDPTPTPAPSSEPTADDIDVVAVHDPASPARFKLHLVERKAGALAAVSSVLYDTHETFGSYQFIDVKETDDGFQTPVYLRTYSHYWRTNGAAVRLTSGTTLRLAGAVIKW
jgi:hypothetical protein